MSSIRVLCVDDSLTARLIVKRTLMAEGYEVVEAPDGQAALAMLDAHSPINIVVLDWNMPVMNGIEFLREMRKNKAYDSIKVLMCTTEAEKSSVASAVQAGASGYLLKPVDPPKLVAQVTKLVGVAA